MTLNDKKLDYLAPECDVICVECKMNVLQQFSGNREVDPAQEDNWGEL